MKIENNVSLDNLKMFDLFEIYYQIACSNITDKHILNLLNEVMDFHFTQIYGTEYNNDMNIINEEFKCIVTFEKIG